MLAMLGTGLVIVKVTELVVVLSGFVTVILAVPGLAISLAGTLAVSWVPETKLVVRADPFQLTVAPLTKFTPLTVRVNAGPSAAIELGLKPVIAGPATTVT